MIRFRNPGSNTDTQVAILRVLYNSFGNASFDLTQMAHAIANKNLMTAYGYAGNSAIELSRRKNSSLNSTEMNAKMYAENFRTLGWLASASEEDSYPLVFTFLGAHVAKSVQHTESLILESVVGYTTDNGIFSKSSYHEKNRAFICMLRMIKDLDGFIYKHELCMGPMSVSDDKSEKEYFERLNFLKELRTNIKQFSDFKIEFKRFADSLKMLPNSVDNCTRFPIEKLKSCKLVVETKESIYGRKNLLCLKISEFGSSQLFRFTNMLDLRLSDFDTFPISKKNALIRLGMYGMLERSCFNLDLIQDKIRKDKNECDGILKGKELLFSPCQTLKNDLVMDALGEISIHASISSSTPKPKDSNQKINLIRKSIEITSQPNCEITDKDYISLKNEIFKLRESGRLNQQIVSHIFDKHKNDSKNEFYPFISLLFRIIGFECECSRDGDNGCRWDAIIKDRERSIPIEIKSPTEEEFISIKAIKQALENKIVLLSRKTHSTNIETTSFAVGYNLPNNRSEVDILINAFKDVFGIKIAVVGLSSLLTIVVSIILDNKSVDREKLYQMEGII